ncbi:hypothetical protein Q5H93_02645 [Hymenobacter sp. ASUV-10]|uniref:Uncharacterized protein n=1 Tax=Hymenobacter aranciens TaxID=3063996 RepID=A0ABT9B5S2_9BACT|nr:hypothetical protein [Hymenobacter sp. ASUV-10]MDO7873616.1 hypothetical protein [Hymenobacter sp. ASUV-10]
MLLYDYWARVSLDCQRADGQPYHLIGYGGSDDSPAAAQAAGQQILLARQARLQAGQSLNEYPTTERPLREQLEQRLYDSQGELLAAITRNGYGSRVLNAPRTMFIDVDDVGLCPPLRPSAWEALLGPRLYGWLQRRLGGAPPVALTPPEAMAQRLSAWLDGHPDWKFRLYRTLRGYRLLVLHQLLPPDGPEAQAVFAALGADTTYVRLCQTQNCYRARLSPKPWRIGWHRPPVAFPFATAAEEAAQHAWEQQYAQRSQAFSVCEGLGDFGTGTSCPEAQQVADVHDAACLGGRPLA